MTPATANALPTNAASTMRGRRICHTIVSAVAGQSARIQFVTHGMRSNKIFHTETKDTPALPHETDRPIVTKRTISRLALHPMYRFRPTVSHLSIHFVGVEQFGQSAQPLR